MTWKPVALSSRAEFARLLDGNPMQLRATLPSIPPRHGHPAFIGPCLPANTLKHGTIRFDVDGSAWVELPERKPIGVMPEVRHLIRYASAGRF